MIGRVVRGGDVGGLLRYVYGPGRRNEHRDPHLVACWDGRPERVEPPVDAAGRYRTAGLARLVAFPLQLRPQHPDRPVWHCSLRAAPGDPPLTDEQWAQLAADVVHRTGIAPRGDAGACRWVAVRHAVDHIHLVAVLARQDGRRFALWRDYPKVRQACRVFEDRLGLVVTAAADQTATPATTRPEAEKAARLGQVASREYLRQVVRRAAAATRGVEEFLASLAAAGVLVKHRPGRGQPVGYAVALSTDVDTAGEPVWYSGGRLAPDLSLPQLRVRWATVPPLEPADSWPQPATTQAAVALAAATRAFGHRASPKVADAVRIARAATAQVCAGADEAPGIAHAAGELLVAAAWVIEGPRGGLVTAATERYDAAVRVPHTSTPQVGPAGAALRAAARTLLAGLGPAAASRDDAAALVGVLIALVAAVVVWHHSHHRLAQAAAARAAEGDLRRAGGVPQVTARPRSPAAVEARVRRVRADLSGRRL